MRGGVPKIEKARQHARRTNQAIDTGNETRHTHAATRLQATKQRISVQSLSRQGVAESVYLRRK